MNNSVKIILALFGVAVISAAAGVLLAPEEGAKTRKKLSKKGKKMWKETKKTAEDIAEKSADIKDKVFKEGEKLFS